MTCSKSAKLLTLIMKAGKGHCSSIVIEGIRVILFFLRKTPHLQKSIKSKTNHISKQKGQQFLFT